MRLLIITDAWRPQINGVVRTYEHINQELRDMGHEVDVIGPGDFPRQMPLPGYGEIKLALAPYRRLVKMIEDHAPESIHIATEGPLGWAARRYCLKNDLQFSTCYHSHFPDYLAQRAAKYLSALHAPVHETTKKAIRHFHAPSAAMMVATQSLEEELKDWGFENPMLRLSRGVDLGLFKPGEKTLFHDLPAPVALYVGRVALEKSIEDFLSMNWEGSKVIVGDGPSLAALSQKYPDAHFAGIKQGEDLARHYQSADLFVFPSKTDTFGMVLVEALACGLPVAAYDVTGPKDIITGDFLGALVGASVDNLSKASYKALESNKKQARHAHAASLYSWKNVAKQFTKAMIPVN